MAASDCVGSSLLATCMCCVVREKARGKRVAHLADTLPCSTRRAGSTLRSSRAVPHPSTDWALRRFTSEVGRDPVHSTRYGRQRLGARDARGCCDWLGAGRQSEVGSQLQAWCVSGSSFARMAVRRKAVRMHAPGSKLAGASGERSSTLRSAPFNFGGRKRSDPCDAATASRATPRPLWPSPSVAAPLGRSTRPPWPIPSATAAFPGRPRTPVLIGPCTA